MVLRPVRVRHVSSSLVLLLPTRAASPLTAQQGLWKSEAKRETRTAGENPASTF